MNPLLLLEEAPLAGITAVYVVLGLAVGAIDALVRDVLGATAEVALVLVGLFFAWQSVGTGVTVAPTLP